MSVHACVHVVCACMPLWVLHNINEADLCDAVLPKALAYTLTCIHANGVMHVMQISTINNALHPFISYQPAPDADPVRPKVINSAWAHTQCLQFCQK